MAQRFGIPAEELKFSYRGLLQKILPRCSDEPSADMTLVSTLLVPHFEALFKGFQNDPYCLRHKIVSTLEFSANITLLKSHKELLVSSYLLADRNFSLVEHQPVHGNFWMNKKSEQEKEFLNYWYSNRELILYVQANITRTSDFRRP